MKRGSLGRVTAALAVLSLSMASGSVRAQAPERKGTPPGPQRLGQGPFALTVTRNAADLAAAITQSSSLVTGAAYVAIPPSSNPAAISDVPTAGFPTNGATFGILSTGDATLFNTANSSGSSGVSAGGGNVRGNSDFDVTILRIDVNVPASANCLSINFKFFSEEFPEFVGSSFNDAFIAELDTSDWTTSGSAITAPHNFAFDPTGKVISINSAGTTSMSAVNATGTTYDGATPLLGASTPVTPGAHSLYLSIFDQGDHIYDSAVALDSLVAGATGPGGCTPGATPLSATVTADRPNTSPGSTDGYTITIHNPNATALSVNSITDTVPFGFAYQPGSTTGITTGEPAQSGFNLSWAGPFSVPGNGTISLHFLVTTYINVSVSFDTASAVGTTASVTPSGPSAVIVINGVALGRVREFDFDGKGDITVYHPASGLWYTRQSSNSATTSIQFGGQGYTPLPFDYDKDGKSDVAAYHPGSGLWFIRQSSNSAVVTIGYGGSGYAPVPGDYDGDGATDLAVFHEPSGLWFIRQSSNSASVSFSFGGTGATPVPGDYDGDGKTDFAVYYQSSGLWFIRPSSTGVAYSVGYGGPGYQPVLGDFDGDGKHDIALYQPTTGLWFVRYSATGLSTTTAFGSAGAVATPSDFDGDGRTDLAVYYASSGLWYVRNSSTGVITSVSYGGTGFDPIF